MIVSPPRLVGTATVAPIFGCTIGRLRHRLAEGQLVGTAGYLGKISGKHTWNLHELCASVFTGDAALELVVGQLSTGSADPLDSVLCAVADCDDPEELLGLCRRHLRRLMTTWRHASRSSLVTVQLVAMCQWVVDRNAHLVLPAGFDPWQPICMTPGCGKSTNFQGPDAWHGPLCLDCSAAFWNNPPGQRRGLFPDKVAA